mmetsp:Transcript_50018/g.119451  ORF Transcript_50018/g.119451 Transcript_50018/m.119451 type:complete len:287 (-) Transcript_50018:245-1105(-)
MYSSSMQKLPAKWSRLLRCARHGFRPLQAISSSAGAAQWPSSSTRRSPASWSALHLRARPPMQALAARAAAALMPSSSRQKQTARRLRHGAAAPAPHASPAGALPRRRARRRRSPAPQTCLGSTTAAAPSRRWPWPPWRSAPPHSSRPGRRGRQPSLEAAGFVPLLAPPCGPRICHWPLASKPAGPVAAGCYWRLPRVQGRSWHTQRAGPAPLAQAPRNLHLLPPPPSLWRAFRASATWRPTKRRPRGGRTGRQPQRRRASSSLPWLAIPRTPAVQGPQTHPAPSA